MMRFVALALLAAPAAAFAPLAYGSLRLRQDLAGQAKLRATIDDSVGTETETAVRPKKLTLAERIAMELDASMEEEARAAPAASGAAPTPELDLMESLFAEDKRQVILFDSGCVFCDTSVQFIMANERPTTQPGGVFRYATQDSDLGKKIIARCCGDMHVSKVAAKSSILLVEQDAYHMRGDAVMRILEELRFPWNLAGAANWLPEDALDQFYEFVSDNRHVFGQKDSCLLPDDVTVTKFLM